MIDICMTQCVFHCSGKKEVGEKKRRRRRKEKQADSEAGECDGEEEEDEEDEDESSDEMEEDIEKLQVTDSPSVTMETADESAATTAVPSGVVTVHTDSVFTVTIGPQGDSSVGDAEGGGTRSSAAPFVPHARMNSMLAVKHGVLYMYGGLYEEGEKQLTLSDIYSLDLRKLDEWHTLVSDNTAPQVSRVATKTVFNS